MSKIFSEAGGYPPNFLQAWITFKGQNPTPLKTIDEFIDLLFLFLTQYSKND